MLTSAAALLLLAPLTPPSAQTWAVPEPDPCPPAATWLAQHGARLDWFEGDHDALLAEARRSERLVFIDFWAVWCGPCKRMLRDTLRDDDVAEELGDLLCWAVDVDSPEGRALSQRYGVDRLPHLLFLEPDGAPRDVLVGFHAPDAFLPELRRIRRDEGTIADLRRVLQRDGGDLEARWALAEKLGRCGDDEGRGEQIEALHRLDPEGRSLPVRRLRLAELRESVFATGRTAELRAFLEGETAPELLFEGWNLLAARAKSQLERAAEAGDEREAAERRSELLVAWHAVWKYCPSDGRAWVGNAIAWRLWEMREHLDRDAIDFAVATAREAHRSSPEDVDVLDTLACCLLMAGEREGAWAALERAMALDPDRELWLERRELFQSFARR